MVTKAKKPARSKKVKAEANGSVAPDSGWSPALDKDQQQQFIEGAEPQEPIAEIDEAARTFLAAKKKLKTAKEDFETADADLLSKMRANNQTRYEHGSGYTVVRSHDETVKMKKRKVT